MMDGAVTLRKADATRRICCAVWSRFPFWGAVVDRVIELHSVLVIKLPDAIIAASAMAESIPLMTRNTEDYSRVPGLILINPFHS